VNPKNILTELKRRNVYRAAVAYGVVAWFLTQLTTQVFPFFEIPNYAVRFVVVALAVGFPIAMLLAWVYEFTPERIVRTEDLQPAQARSSQRATGRILDFIIIGALLLVIAMLVVGRLPFYRQTGESISQKSIAVLPFENLSEDYVARRRGEWDRSESYFNEAERLDPRNVNLLTQHAISYKCLRRFPQALRKFDQVPILRRTTWMPLQQLPVLHKLRATCRGQRHY
jgi:tetratricopeptide (TPR) repeat protein